MAVSPVSCLHSKMNSTQLSLSSASKVHVCLRDCLGVGIPNLNVEFRDKVYKSIKRCSNGKATRGRITMMPIGVPRVPYRNRAERTWQWIDMWNALYRDRIVFVAQYIDEEFSNQLLATMLYLDTVDDSDKLYLYVNGPGGDLNASLAIYDTMHSLKSPLSTLCMGYTVNMASFIVAAGEKGSRSIMPLGRMALQSPAGSAYGQADDVINEAEELVRVRDYLFKELARNTGQPIEKVEKDFSVVKYFSAQEAVEYGLVDRIVKPGRVKPNARPQDSTNGLG